MRPFLVRHVVGWTALLLVLPGSLAARSNARRGFDLFASGQNVLLNGNRVQCNINGVGELCVNPNNSPSFGGGFWPAGTEDQYVFNQGLQFAAVTAGTDLPGFPWPGDTIGAFFFDPRGDQQHGTALTPIYDSRSGRDRLQWPAAARANDPALFDAALLGRPVVSDQDSWVRYWDGNVHQTNGRPHPAGLLVDQRTMAWNGPGLRDVLFFVYRVINISSRTAASYQRLAAAGYEPDAIAEVAAIGERFQDAMEQQYNVQIPDTGYTMRDAYVGFAQDADIGQAGSNYTTANLIFDAPISYKADFREPTWQYPGDIFGPPFAAAPGFVANAILRGPRDTSAAGAPLGLTIVSTTANGVLPEAVGVAKLWRWLSMNLLPLEGNCSVPDPKVRRFCALVQTPRDTRIFMSSGPTTLDPGASALFVVAQVHAAAIDSIVRPFVGGNMMPGLPITGGRLVQGIDTVRIVDRAAGWLSHSDVNGNTRIDPDEVVTRPMSLYWKIQQARAALAAGFLQPSAPEAPQVMVVPGDGRATVVWQRSATEATGDPYAAVAANPTTALYDPSFRAADVEGYRVWRGRSPTEMQVIAQFDYAGTQMMDYAGQAYNGFTGPGGGVLGDRSCVPELGVTTSCPTLPRAVGMSGYVIQYRLGDRTVLQNNAVLPLRADTAGSHGAGPRLPLSDNTVPFVWVDSGVTNGVPYFYAVTAFDVNSIRSGPSSLESPLVLRAVTPRIPSGREMAGGVSAVRLLDRNGSELVLGAVPSLNSATAIFSGPMPPTDAIDVSLVSYVSQLVSDGAVTLTLDSVVPGEWFSGTMPARYWFTGQGAGAPVRISIDVQGLSTSNFGDVVAGTSFPAIAADSAQSGRFGGDATFALYGAASVRVNGSYRYTSQYRALVNSDPGTGTSAGPRWWVGAGNENVPDPNGINCLTTAVFTCTLANLTRNAGQLAGVGIMNIAAYGTIGTTEPIRSIEGITAGVFRAADFRWYWGAGGVVDSVVDVTHNVRVPFHRKIRASWGILTDSSFTNVVSKDSVSPANTGLRDTSRTRLTWSDAACIAPAPQYVGSCGGATNWPAADGGAFLMNHARLSPVSFASQTYPGTMALSAVAATGTGFILYLNGHFFLMQMASLPPAGTVWSMRSYAGNITGAAGAYLFQPATRPAAVPGLRLQLAYTGSTLDSSVTNAALLARVHTVPDPYYLTNSLETAGRQVLRFVNLPERAIIRIYSLSGVLLQVLTHNDPTGGGEEGWDLRTRNGGRVATAVYLYHVEAADGATRVGRFTVVNRDN